MSSKGKLSAFAVLKGKKAASLTNVSEQTPKEKSKKKSSSTNTTPTGSASKPSSITNLINKITQSEKKKSRNELKRAKKLLKAESRTPRSLLPESALQSPLVSNNELKSLRPKASTPIRNYQLPLKATSEISISPKKGNLQYKETHIGTPDVTDSPSPPLPPRRMRARQTDQPIAAKHVHISPKTSKASKKRTSSKTDVLPSPDTAKHSTRKSSAAAASRSGSGASDETTIPPKPAKRRRLSQGSAPPSPQHTASTSGTPTRKSAVLSPSGGQERTEPIPAHPSEQRSALPYMFDSEDEARKLFECLIHPVKPDKFFQELWEKKPLLVKRHMPNYNDGWFSCAELDRMLRENTLSFGENLDVVQYVNGKRETLNPPGRAYPPVVWDYYQTGCSVRILNPQTYSRNVWKLLSILQEYFGCMTGANIYLTPPGTQGFAPHYDDIEAFIVQLEGKKHWRLYCPKSEKEALPKHSSHNFTDADIGEPILDVILEAGDLLYFPRGTIHQGKTEEDAHSLHITVSCMQQNTWGDLLEKIVPRALQIGFEEDIEFRKSLPRDYLNYMGIAFSDVDCPQRQQFLRKIEQLMSKLLTYAPVDAAVDQMAKKYVHDSLPPVLTESEKQCSIHGTGETWNAQENRVVGATELNPDDEIKIIRKGAIRIVTEDDEDKVCIFHNLENARVYHGKELQFIEISSDLAPGVEYLLHHYPNFVAIDDLPLESLEDKIELASALYDKGLVITSKPLEPVSDDESGSDVASDDFDENIENQQPLVVRNGPTRASMYKSSAI